MEGTAVELGVQSYGDGYGDGDGDGDGSGYGSGDGYGYGSGDGYGSGYGSGYGYGYGYGSGDGYGDGDGEKAQQVYFDGLLQQHEKPGLYLAFWRSDKDGSPANGGKIGEKASIGLTQEVAGPLQLCGPNAIHATRKPTAWKGERWWIVALHEPVKHQDDKSGSLKRTIIADLGKCPFE